MRKLQVMFCSVIFSTMVSGCVSAAGAKDNSSAGETDQAAITQLSDTAVQPDSDTEAPVATTPDTASDSTVRALATSADPYNVKSFFADFTHFAIGDTVPELYRSKKYEVTLWTARHLPAPVPESHWTYMGGNYVMITNAEGKILKAESGDIYYNH